MIAKGFTPRIWGKSLRDHGNQPFRSAGQPTEHPETRLEAQPEHHQGGPVAVGLPRRSPGAGTGGARRACRAAVDNTTAAQALIPGQRLAGRHQPVCDAPPARRLVGSGDAPSQLPGRVTTISGFGPATRDRDRCHGTSGQTAASTTAAGSAAGSSRPRAARAPCSQYRPGYCWGRTQAARAAVRLAPARQRDEPARSRVSGDEPASPRPPSPPRRRPAAPARRRSARSPARVGLAASRRRSPPPVRPAAASAAPAATARRRERPGAAPAAPAPAAPAPAASAGTPGPRAGRAPRRPRPPRRQARCSACGRDTSLARIAALVVTFMAAMRPLSQARYSRWTTPTGRAEWSPAGGRARPDALAAS